MFNNGDFYQWINVYYSCATIIFSILSYIDKNDDLSLLTIFMSISLLAAMLYLNPQQYFTQASAFRENYTEIQKLEYALKHLTPQDTDFVKNIEMKYCELMASSNNHITFDYYCAVRDRSDDEGKKRWPGIRNIYYLNVIWAYVIKVVLLMLPIVLYIWQVKF